MTEARHEALSTTVLREGNVAGLSTMSSRRPPRTFAVFFPVSPVSFEVRLIQMLKGIGCISRRDQTKAKLGDLPF
jgi:hypothetical protein